MNSQNTSVVEETILEVELKNIIEKRYMMMEASYSNGDDVFSTFTASNIEGCKAVVIYGDNCSGKSFIAKFLDSVMRQTHKVAVRSASVGNRVGGGVENVMIYGNEKEESTGVTSFKVMNLGLKSTSETRGSAMMILDEPTLGMSPRYSRATGTYVATKFNDMDDDKFIVVISHEVEFIKSFIKTCSKPVCGLGVETELNLDDWLNSDIEAPIEELESLSDTANDKWRAIAQLQEKMRYM
ncbi:conserved hypothetical protein [Vibrio chagasii]|nr:conserved hypothetical protein [Vibrio chagasii]